MAARDFKTCTWCSREFPNTEEYFFKVWNKDRLRANCKECHIAYNSQKRREREEKRRPKKPAPTYVSYPNVEVCLDAILMDIEATPGEGDRLREVLAAREN